MALFLIKDTLYNLGNKHFKQLQVVSSVLLSLSYLKVTIYKSIHNQDLTEHNVLSLSVTLGADR